MEGRRGGGGGGGDTGKRIGISHASFNKICRNMITRESCFPLISLSPHVRNLSCNLESPQKMVWYLIELELPAVAEGGQDFPQFLLSSLLILCRYHMQRQKALQGQFIRPVPSHLKIVCAGGVGRYSKNTLHTHSWGSYSYYSSWSSSPTNDIFNK